MDDILSLEVEHPHVLVFPFPIQGHMNSMLHFSQLLSLSNIQVTFLITAYNHHRLTQYTDIHTHLARNYPLFRFEIVSDGLPIDHPRSGDFMVELLMALRQTVRPLLMEILTVKVKPPVTCFVVDGICGFAYEICHEVGIPVIAFRTSSACFFWSNFCIPELIKAGEVPIKDGDDLDELVKNVPRMENFLRRRDLAPYCRAKDLAPDPSLHLISSETLRTRQAHALILNTFEELEGPVLAQIRAHCCPKVYTIGPLHAHLKYRLLHNMNFANASTTTISTCQNSLREEDRTCIKWLDERPDRSVVYVSFGSITTLTRAQLIEFWAGLVLAKHFFLWVIRSDLMTANDTDSSIPPVIMEDTNKRGCIVRWAPQEEVLAHPAIGGFLTHSGWNSTLESIVAMVPMACWPYFADQHINSRYVDRVWKVGLDMKDTCDREIVRRVVHDLMERRRDDLDSSIADVARLANKSVACGGSSYNNLDQLIQDIKLMVGNKKFIY